MSFQLWNGILSDTEIAQYYSNSPIGNEANLVGYWNFDENNGNSLNNISSSSLNGIISGATWSTDIPLINNCNATDDIVVTVNPLPTIDLGVDTTLICAGTSHTIRCWNSFCFLLVERWFYQSNFID